MSKNRKLAADVEHQMLLNIREKLEKGIPLTVAELESLKTIDAVSRRHDHVGERIIDGALKAFTALVKGVAYTAGGMAVATLSYNLDEDKPRYAMLHKFSEKLIELLRPKN